MKNLITQKTRIVKRLNEYGKISRNECLRVYISRLGAIICDLTKEGWQFETENKDGDYIYKVTRSPFHKVMYKLPSGENLIEYHK